ncbi:MAG: LTA synthase family protein [Erysipelotrichaceae bacterium]|nr:LTA synthase family protein [Erysipelotrichaceae bacterium]
MDEQKKTGVEVKSTKKEKRVGKLISAIIRYIGIALYFVLYLQVFLQKLYLNEEGGFNVLPIIAGTAIFVVTVLIYRKDFKVPEKWNTFVSILASGIVMVGNYVLLQWSQGYEIFLLEFNTKSDALKLIIINMLYIFLIFLIIFAITSSFKMSIRGLTLITVIFGLANFYVVKFRGVGIIAADFFSLDAAGNVAGSYSYGFDDHIYIFLMISAAICLLAGKLNKNTFLRRYWRLLPVVLSVCLVMFTYQKLFVSDHYSKLLKVKYFRPQETFSMRGMYANFFKSVDDLFVKKPEGYSVDEVKKIAKQYAVPSKTTTEEVPNIIIVMSEAFTDFSTTDMKTNKDYAPFFHSLKEDTIKGNFYVSVFGGGTASTEFEVLTSNSMAFVPNGITAYTSYIHSPMASITSTLAKQNYGRLLAMHPYLGNGYNRHNVYPLLGFEKYITIDDFKKTKKNMYGRHISDEADSQRIIKEYEDYVDEKGDDEGFMMFNVTIQNHSPFTDEGLPDEIKIKNVDGIPEADQFVDQIKASDDALETLVSYFQSIDDPTMIVFFGDHQPKVEEKLYESLNTTANVPEGYEDFWKNITQFMIWTNYDIEEQEDVNISANYFSSLILETAGLKTTTYQHMTSEIRKKIPVITKRGYVGDDHKFYDLDDEASPYYDLIQQYNYVEYNNIFDVKNRYNQMFDLN